LRAPDLQLSTGDNVLDTHAAARTEPGSWRSELSDLIRGLSGGFLFGIPLLYTMEVWWIGTHSEPWRLLIILLVSFAINLMVSSFSGFRQEDEAHRPITDALEALAIGVVASTATLLVLGEIHPEQPLDMIIGVIVLESVPFSLGVSIASGLLRGNKEDPEGGSQNGQSDDREQQENQGDGEESGGNSTLRDAGATIAGALFISFSIAPTEEVPMLTANLSSLGLVMLVFFSLVVSYAITFEAGFADQHVRRSQQGVFQGPLSETIFSYLIALVVAAVLLWLFKQLETSDPLLVWLERTIVLGLPAAIGGSAGRLAAGG
jgi:putative integral membrane protein (TIGR02587 family)